MLPYTRMKLIVQRCGVSPKSFVKSILRRLVIFVRACFRPDRHLLYINIGSMAGGILPVCLLAALTVVCVCWNSGIVIGCSHTMDKAPTCLANLQIRGSPLPVPQADALDMEARVQNRELKRSGRRRGWAGKPCVRLQGPLFPILGADTSCCHPLGVGNRWHCL